MKPFGQWFNDSSRTPAVEPVQPTETVEDELPEGVSQHKDGSYWACCRSCDRSYELVYDPKDFTEEYNYCNGSQYCMP